MKGLHSIRTSYWNGEAACLQLSDCKLPCACPAGSELSFESWTFLPLRFFNFRQERFFGSREWVPASARDGRRASRHRHVWIID